MKKRVAFSMKGHRADIGEYMINRLLPSARAKSIGPFVFLDHLLPAELSPDAPVKKVNGTGAHPHRGIATLTYIINGEADHFDSNGNHAKVSSGGAQWMKAGNGIIHDEAINADVKANDHRTHAMQFWVNLPSRNKAESPEYVPVQAEEVPQHYLTNSSGWIKVIDGTFENQASKIPNYTKQFIYHIHLEAGKQFSMLTETELEYAAFLPLHNAEINEVLYKKGDLIAFDKDNGTIEITNKSNEGIDVILFGGAKYTEPIVFGGPFVMNSELEIAQAYDDFHAGKYGKINYTVEVQ
ncbi:hypothetical protein WSM22_31300 [Cytophagales bacterium WSM2-2]|nr:hypothetical protein WSM22_31300 [Cytophagales bacterium WSM2-2]